MLAAALFLAAAVVHGESPLACNRAALSDAERRRHSDELGPALRGLVKHSREVRDGYEFEFPADVASFRLVAEWMAGEHLCCPFFDIVLVQEREGATLRMRLTGRKGVKQFIKADLGRWIRQ